MKIVTLPVEHQAVPLVIVNVADAAFRREIGFSVGVVASILILPIYDDVPRSVDKVEQVERFISSTWLRSCISHCYFFSSSLSLYVAQIHNVKLEVNLKKILSSLLRAFCMHYKFVMFPGSIVLFVSRTSLFITHTENVLISLTA